MLSQAEKEAVTAIFVALGPEGVEKGMTAHGHGWHTCFIGKALTVRGKTARCATQILDILPVSLVHLDRFISLWDGEFNHAHGQAAIIRQLAAEWLEQNRSVPTPAEVASCPTS